MAFARTMTTLASSPPSRPRATVADRRGGDEAATPPALPLESPGEGVIVVVAAGHSRFVDRAAARGLARVPAPGLSFASLISPLQGDLP
jgi:hypothetical protein